MNKLVINTANDELFIVLQKNNQIFSKSINSRMHHNETMLPVIDGLLTENKIALEEIEEFGIIIGPGSFTGIRVGIATIKAFRDALDKKAKGINNLDYLYALSKNINPNIETVAILGSKDSYFVAKLINGVVYKFERNLTHDELVALAEDKPIGMFMVDETLKCVVVKQNAEVLLECLANSKDESLVPVYYQLSQAENEKLKKAQISVETADLTDFEAIYDIEKNNISINALSEDNVKSALTDDNYVTLKAVIDNETVGFIILQKSDELNIDSVAVKKSFRNLGVATKLIEKASVVAKENFIENLSLEVGCKNITAYLLYKKLGFVERRVRKNYYVDGTDAIEMIKSV